MNKTLRKYIITAAIALAVAGLVFLYELKILEVKDSTTRLLSDSFFVSGIFTFIAGVFAFISNGGGFDSFAYLGHKLKRTVNKGLREEEGKMPEYHEFVQSRRDKGKISMTHLLVVGTVLIVTAIILAFLV